MLTVEKSGFIPSVNLPTKIHPQSPTAQKAAYLGVPLYIRDSWLKNIQNKATTPTPSLQTENENKLIQSVLGDPNDANQKILLQFCNVLRANTQGSLSAQNSLIVGSSLTACKEQIGQLIFLAERNLAQTASFINLLDIQASTKKIQAAFDAEIQTILTNIEAHRKQHERISLQDPTLVVSIQKPLAMATILTTSSGLINLGLIDSVKSSFFDSKAVLRHYEKDALQTLEDLKNSPEIQQAVAKILKPASPFFVSNDLIRISLGLPPTATPTDQQAKTVGLAALLSDMRQGDVGSCFATSVSILMMGTLKAKVISDFCDILNQGKLSRSSQTDQVDFIPVIDIGDGNSQKTLSVDKNGKLSTGNGYLWESPGIIAACRQLSIIDGNVESYIKAMVKESYPKNHTVQNTLDFTVEDLVKQLIIVTKGNSLSVQDATELKNLALVAFSAETNTPLLRAWESCLAAMAEASNGNNVRQKILNCVAAPLSDQWPKDFYRKLTADAKRVQDIFTRMLDSGIQLRYDEQVAVKASQQGGDGHSKTLGAFVLHELTQGERSTAAKKITSPEEFRSFVLNRLQATQEVVNNITPLADSKRKSYQQTIDKINTFITKTQTGFNSFLYKAIKEYDNENATVTNDLANWDELEHLPFRDATGDDNSAVFTKATGFNAGQSDSVRPQNAEELLEAFINFGRKRAKIDNFLNDEDPYQRYMVDTPQHAFTLTPEDSSVVSAMTEGKTPHEWIQQNLIKPGLAVSNLPLSNAQKNNLITFAKTQMIPAELQSAFNQALKSIHSSGATVNSFANQLANAILSISPRQDEAVRTFVFSSLTKAYFDQILPPAAKKLLTDSVAKIADTNWVDEGVRHIYFACFFDPVTNSLQLGTIDEDGTGLNPLDQNEWVTFVPWEMYGVKLTPTLADHKVVQLKV